MADLRGRIQQELSGAYTLERELGGGGMSRVFVADEHHLGRKVVVKVLSPDIAAAMSTTRFEREIRVAASLQQANIVPVFAAGSVDGLPYYTMPFVEGESLRARLGRGSLAIAEVVSILRDVSRALAYAHGHGVVHRDIKPDNVLLSGHTAVVTDFGIAKAIEAAVEGPSGATLTQLGTAVGTPAYMAPEQAAGDPATDHRADVYAFGCMAWELLAGQAPFASLPPHKLLAAHMTETPRPIGELRADCPPALASLVAQCMAKAPEARPSSAAEIISRLDAVASPSAAQPAVPAILLGGRGMLVRALAVYAGAFAVVAILAKAAIIAIGLPDWVFPGALIVMALGLPIILLTGYAQYAARRAATATPTFTPGGTPAHGPQGTMATLALKASPHMSWRRTARGGIFAVAGFALLVTAFMALRALGIGPAGSLLAAGKLSASDKVVVAAFDAPAADSSLGTTISEAVRTNLAQSRAVRVVPTSAIVAALEQMQRPDTARLDFGTARDVAQRAGAKAVVAGSIVPAGGGFILAARLVAAESGDELASHRESVRDAGDLIPAVDRLTKWLRGRIGESLKEVRDAPRLDQVSTASLAALKSYAAGLRANDVQGDHATAVTRFQEATREDSLFAMAYVQLSYSLQALGGPVNNARADTAINTAFRLRDRLPERERYNVEGGYYLATGLDRRKAIAALRRAVELDSANLDAANSLAIVLEDTRDFAGAERAYQLAIASDSGNGTLLTNLASMYTVIGRHAAFDSVMAVIDQRRIPFATGLFRSLELWNRRLYDSVEAINRAFADTAPPRARLGVQDGLFTIAITRGRLADAERRYSQLIDARLRIRGDSANPGDVAFIRAMIHGHLRGDVPKAIAMLDAARQTATGPAVPLPRDRSPLLGWAYATLGEPARARELLDRFSARLDDEDRARRVVQTSRLRGLIALTDNPDSAVAIFRQSDVAGDGLPVRDCTPCTPLYLGRAFDQAGQPDSARKYLTEYVEMAGSDRPTIDRWYLAKTLFRLGELYEAANDARAATEYYGRFVDLWAHADPELQPRVTEARSRIDRLNRDKR